jgi:hypothetical protein
MPRFAAVCRIFAYATLHSSSPFKQSQKTKKKTVTTISGNDANCVGLLDNAVVGYYCSSGFLDYRHFKHN